jgi:hypothetical protein
MVLLMSFANLFPQTGKAGKNFFPVAGFFVRFK